MNKSIFITGTDTDVGKTFVSALIINKLISLNKNVSYIKPVETGLGKELKSLDYSFIKKINPSLKISEQEAVIEKCIYPLAPKDSLEMEKREININDLIKKTKETANKYEYSVIEGAGGVLVPIVENYLIIDLIKDLNIPVLVVGRSGLGTINHTCLTIEALTRRGICVKAFILNGKGEELALKNSENITQLTGIKCASIIPYFINFCMDLINIVNIDLNLIFDL